MQKGSKSVVNPLYDRPLCRVAPIDDGGYAIRFLGIEARRAKGHPSPAIRLWFVVLGISGTLQTAATRVSEISK
jgi:hypothetical protein